jgi:anti-sigma factor RsiW
MGCRTYFENLTAFIDGELPAPESQRISAHLEVCDTCRAEHGSLLFAMQAVDSQVHEGLEPPAWELIRNEIATPQPRWSDFGWLFQPRWAGAVAVLALFVFSLPFYWSATEPQAMLAQQLAVYVSERDQAEEIHRGIIEIEPVGWVTHNPFRVGRSSENPFSAE